MNKIAIFSNEEFGSVRGIEIDGEPWLVGKDVTAILGYRNASKALADHVDSEDKLNNESLSSLGQRGGWLINESGLYSLVMSSRLPKAKDLQKWITSEVLPNMGGNSVEMTTKANEFNEKEETKMNKMKIFNNTEFGNVRGIEIDGEAWLVGKDVAAALGYANARDALSKHVDDEDRGVAKCDTHGGKQTVTIINESGLYSLIMSSKLPAAKKFKRWVTAEVLPAIRKHGAYMTPETIERILMNPDTIINIATQLKDERTRRIRLEAENERQKQEIETLKPIKRYADLILSSEGTMTVSQIAADYDMSAIELNKILLEEQIQHKVGRQWILYKKHMGKGYTDSNTVPITHSDGRHDAVVHTQWTQKGRLMIHDILARRGIQAVMDKEQAV